MANIRPAEIRDCAEIARLHLLLWPECELVQEKPQIEAVLSTGRCGTLPAVVFVAEATDGKLVGFIEAGLRSHADGCDTSRPVGFVEGWFVQQEYRTLGLGRALMLSAENWARQQDAIEMASDALITEEGSHRAHRALGFEVVDRCVHFRKSL
jgi:aminoglycoside 6'-N-acetyltransferase I